MLPHQGADDVAVGMQCLAQAAGERVGQAEDAGGNAFGTPRRGSQPAAAVRAVYPHIRQVGAGVGQRIVFIVRQLGIHPRMAA